MAGTSSAAARSAHFEWTAPPECASVETLRARVEGVLGEDLSEGDAFDASASVTRDTGGSFTLTLSVRTADSTGTRTVHADDCASLLQVAAFSIALALNPELAAAVSPPVAESAEPPKATPLAPEPRATTPPPPAAPKPQAADEDAPLTTDPSAQNSEPAPAPELWFAGHALFDSSLLPHPASGLEALGEVLLFERIRLGLGGEAFLPQLKRGATGGGYFTLWSLDAHACVQGRFGIVLGACPTFRLAQEHAAGRGVVPALRQTAWVPAPGMTLLALAALSPRLAASLRATGVVTLDRATFVIRSGQVHAIPDFSFELALGMVVRAF